jgi:hypothetical protein
MATEGDLYCFLGARSQSIFGCYKLNVYISAMLIMVYVGPP